MIRQPTLIIAGSDDPGHSACQCQDHAASCCRTATLHVHDGGHVDLIASAAEQAGVVTTFLAG